MREHCLGLHVCIDVYNPHFKKQKAIKGGVEPWFHVCTLITIACKRVHFFACNTLVIMSHYEQIQRLTC